MNYDRLHQKDLGRVAGGELTEVNICHGSKKRKEATNHDT